MTLQEILDFVLLKYPHGLSNDEVISIINQVQRELFRTMYKPQTATQYDLLADNPFYTLGFSPQKIIELIVNGEEYPPINIRDDNVCQNFYYTTESNTIGIYPTPTDDVSGGLVIFHYVEPKKLAGTDLDVDPDFDSDWHMLIVYRVCKEIAESSRDSDMMNGFITQINGLEAEYNKGVFYEPTQIQERW